MALPEDWRSVDWRASVVILPEVTAGYPTVAISALRYPQHPSGYYMMAYLDAQSRRVVGYNARDVGSGGALMAQFVFMHEVGHHVLGHTGDLRPGDMEGVTYTEDKELDADHHAALHWLGRGDLHGLQVVGAAIDYFAKQGDAPGSPTHPAPAVRRQHLVQMLQSQKLYSFTIHNDPVTPQGFVRDIFTQCFGYPMGDPAIDNLIRMAEQDKSVTLYSKANGRLINRAEADNIMSFVTAKRKMGGQMQFNMSCQAVG